MKFNSPLEIYKLLPKTNCRECNLPSCMAFSAAVFKAQKRLADCPQIDKSTIGRFEENSGAQSSMERRWEDLLKDLKEKIREMDILSRAALMGAETDGKIIRIKCLGKEFVIDAEGNLASQCHTHIWFAIPVFSYLLFGSGQDPSGEWVPFRELKNASTWGPLFEQRCERPMKAVADKHPELFESLISIFSGIRNTDIPSKIKADVSVMLFPFPKFPILICYWRPEDDLESELHVFFDRGAEANLKIEIIFLLGTGIAGMLEKIMLKHA